MAPTETLAPAVPPIPLNIPPSSTSVKVSIIDTTARISDISIAAFMVPTYKGYETLQNCPAFSFLITHPSGRRLLFDLGIRQDLSNYAPLIQDRLRNNGWTVTVEKNVSDILLDHSIPLTTIEAIIWSHHHWDHVGDPSTFPSTTALIVGPGFKEHFTPAYPEDPSSPILTSDYSSRPLVELSFSASSPRIGRFPAHDYFGDGSFYLLHTPGHTIDHICALVRTSLDPPSYMFLGGDACHHGGEFRPTSYLPLPRTLSPNPLTSPKHLTPSSSLPTYTPVPPPSPFPTPLPSTLFTRIHRIPHCCNEPFYALGGGPDGKGFSYSIADATSVIRGVEEFDAHDDILTVIAHDASLLGVVDFFPNEAQGWRERGWKERGKWRFLGDFGGAVEE
ncbi:hypothetical protein MMC20_002034 [Loxospora ochrophaea]|nr:hypothetical protein [Loxospora ochrophaea]